MSDALDDLRRRLDSLAAPDGEFRVICPDTGESPVPLKGTSFATPAAAERAVDLARAYRDALREVDPHLAERRLVAFESAVDPLALADAGEESAGDGTSTLERTAARGSVVLSGDGDDEWLRIDGAPVVRIRQDGRLVDDAVVGYRLGIEL